MLSYLPRTIDFSNCAGRADQRSSPSRPKGAGASRNNTSVTYLGGVFKQRRWRAAEEYRDCQSLCGMSEQHRVGF